MSQIGGSVADKMGLSKIQLFPVRVMRKIGAFHNTEFKKRVERGEDKDGRKFPGYTKRYADLKARRFTSETGKKYKYPRAPIVSTETGTPDMTLTGHMLRNLQLDVAKTKKTQWVLKLTGEHAEKAIGHKKRGRNIIDDIPNKEKDKLVKLLAQEAGIQFKKLKNVTLTVGK
jgi:hypothetical protein